MDKAKLRESVAKFAGRVDLLRDQADRLHESGWAYWVPARRGERHGLVAEVLRGEIIRAAMLEGQRGDLMCYSPGGDEEPTCDADGHTIMAGHYTGLGTNSMEVQVYILERASKEDTVTMLRKMADWLEDDWGNLTEPERCESKHGPAEEFSPHEPGELPF